MLTLKDFRPFQHRGVDFVVGNPRSMMWLDMAMGKTAITLTAFQRLQNVLAAYRAIVIAPRLVAETVWRQEVEKWAHLRSLRVLLLRGPNDKKLRDLHRPHDIAVINFESIPWLVRAINSEFLAHGQYPPWNMMIIDEIDRLKNSQGKRFQLIELLFPYFQIRVGLTGTPAANGYKDLHGQYLCIDDGARLYKNLGDFRSAWLKAGYAEQSWDLRPGAEEEIRERIKDITLSMSADDYLSLPDYMYHQHWVDLDPKVQKEYDRLEKDMFAQLDRHVEDPIDGEWTMEVHTALSARAKCRQLANGAVLNPDNSGTVMLVHDAKLEMLDSIVHEAAGKPILLAYMFRHDWYRIKARYEKEGYRVGYVGPGVKDVENVIAQWNACQYHILGAHPAAVGHGLNLQFGGNELTWFSLTDNLAYYLQMNARLRRLGQAAPNVNIRMILARNTIDVVLAELLVRKEGTQADLRKAIEAYRRTK